ncbi:protein ENHANCED DISEASE RESISTANCE 4-like isoform X1 [Zingiber officinale]|uniref:Zinc-ribbon domain-containing protein n=1 Tax=Zingiber officinale TaxID=94328 RepID=A0A8J5HGN7_ZINOF|nr:protein ENHANCED DISEASE RESISTANCE 4-like isoform X1 [Zingiber officinale]KAG6526645.1 hypothetical protein ZIOFF_016639 [Zingiber officinale]
MASNSTIPGFRFVRCPRCMALLTEIACVPVYQCGECGVTLRAKHYNSTNQSAASLVSQSSKPEDASSSGLNKGDEESCLKERQMEIEASSSNVRSMDLKSSSPNNRNDASLDDKENNNNHHSECGKVSKIASANAFDVSISSVIETGNTETPRKRVPLSRRTFRGMSWDSADTNVHKEEGVKEKQVGTQIVAQEVSQESPIEKPAALDTFGSLGNEISQNEKDDLVINPSFVSEIDTGNVETSRKCVPLSRRTFRRIVQDSADTNVHKEEGVKEMQVGTQIVAHEVSQESPIEKPAALDTFGSHTNEVSQKEKDDLVTHSSFDSDDFHSVQNLMESENHVHSRSASINLVEVSKGSADKQNDRAVADLDSFEISRDSKVPMGLLNIQTEILRKVDGLKEEINEIFDKSDESRAQPHHVKHLKPGRRQTPPKVTHQRNAIPRPPPRSNGIPSKPFDVPCKHCHYEGRQASPSPCHNGICRACHCNHTCHAGSRPSPCSHKPQVERQTEKPNNNDGRQQKKQLCRPVLGGSPFVVCYNCLELLRLPIDFFIAQRRFYKLQCGACSKVLTFSFRTPKYGIPHTPDEAETPTTELDSMTDTTPGHEVSIFLSNDRSPWEPVSYSDCGYSLASDTEMPVNFPSRSTLMDKRKSRLRTGSQLYQLMDYGSASEILYRHSDIDEVSEFTAPSTPRCNTPKERLVEDGMIRKGSYVSDPSTSQHF